MGICGLDNIYQAMVVVGQLMPLGIYHSRLACLVLASCTFKLLNFRWGLQLLPDEVQVISPSSKQGRRLLHLHQEALSWLLHPLLHCHHLGRENIRVIHLWVRVVGACLHPVEVAPQPWQASIMVADSLSCPGIFFCLIALGQCGLDRDAFGRSLRCALTRGVSALYEGSPH